MIYKQQFNQWFLQKPAAVLSLATTGVRSDDKVIGVWVQEIESPTFDFRMVEGADIAPNKEFHHIPQELYEGTKKPATEVVMWLRDFLNSHTVFTYNLSFMVKFLARLDEVRGMPEAMYLHDIVKLYSWINMAHPFPDEGNCSLEFIEEEISGWTTRRLPPVKSVLSEAVPSFVISESAVVPASMCSGLCQLFEALGKREVPFLVSVSPERRQRLVPVIPFAKGL